MENTINTNQQVANTKNDFLSALVNNKKILIILGVTGLAVLTGVVIAFFTSNTNKTARQSNAGVIVTSNNTGSTGQTNTGFSVSSQAPPSELSASPEKAALNFYKWYVSHPSPVASGAYKTKPDITDEYKEIMSRYAARGLSTTRDDIFNCGIFPLPVSVTALPAQSEPYVKQALVTLRDNLNRDLYQIKLQQAGEDWLVRDVWCTP